MPILFLTEQQAAKLRRLLDHRIVGAGRIEVLTTPDVTTITDRRTPMAEPSNGGGGDVMSGVILVRVKRTSGNGGSATNPATWRYDIWPADKLPSEDTEDVFRLAGALQPQNRNNQPGLILDAITDSFGLASINPLASDPNNAWVLLIAFNERLATAACP